MAGAIVSLFGRGLGASGIVTLTDAAGRFTLPSLPAGSYTLRALGEGHQPLRPRQITVLPDTGADFRVSLVPLGEPAIVEAATAAVAGTPPPATTPDGQRELRWLVRHKQRSVLETTDDTAVVESADRPRTSTGLAPYLGGRVELMTTPRRADGTDARANPVSTGLVRLGGRVADGGRWSVTGFLSENESSAWRMAAEIAVRADGHEMTFGSGYGSRFVRPQGIAPGTEDGGVGALLAEDRWAISKRVTASFGARFTSVRFLRDSNHLDPSAAVEVKVGRDTIVVGSASRRSLMPGGDLLTLSTLATAPSMSLANAHADLRAERILRAALAIERTVGGSELRAEAFHERVSDQLLNGFGGTGDELAIGNGGGYDTSGVGVRFGRQFGRVVSGAVTYRVGLSSRDEESLVLFPGAWDDAEFHDLVTEMQTVVEETDTRLMAYYRINMVTPDREGATSTPMTSTRFDVQLRQGLPFLGALTRADWEVLFAFRNLFYETAEGATLDETTVVNSPRRMLGGISVRF